MPYADSIEVQSLTGKTTIKNAAGANIISSVIVDAIERSDSRVRGETGVSWDDPTDGSYGMIKQASEYFAASYILIRYSDSAGDNKQAMTYYQMALDVCSSVARSSTRSIAVGSKAYQSFPINPSGSIHRSLYPGSDTTLAGDY